MAAAEERKAADGPAGADSKTVTVFMPGRVCLLGEHSDWAGGYRRFNAEVAVGCTIVCPTNQGLYCTATAAEDVAVTNSSDEGAHGSMPSFSCAADRRALLKVAREGGPWSYVAGTVYTMMTNYDVGGIHVAITKQDLPIGKGLSSSACVCTAVAKCYSLVYGLKLSPRGIMEAGYVGERTTPSKCGRMDQACAYQVPVKMTYDGDFVEVEPLHIGREVHLVVVDLCGEKDTVTILEALQRAYPHAATDTHRAVQRWLGKDNLAVTAAAEEALRRGDLVALASAMKQAQRGMDESGAAACPDQLTAPLLHKVIDSEALAPHVLAVKCVGAGGDGTAQVLCKDRQAQEHVCRIVAEELGMVPLVLTLHPTSK